MESIAFLAAVCRYIRKIVIVLSLVVLTQVPFEVNWAK